MARTQWQGTELAVAQVESVTIGGTPTVGSIYSIAIGGITVCTYTAESTPTVTTVRDGLKADWDAANSIGLTHPYSSLLTIADKSTDALTLTCQVAGWPLTITVTEDDTTGSIAKATDTAPLGPNFWDHAANWSNGLPANDDDAVVADNNIDICWGLDGLSAVTVALFEIKKSYTGRIGLRRDEFAISANGRTTNPAVMEYRALYLKMGADKVIIGDGVGTGSDRIKHWNNEAAPTDDTFVKGSAASSAEIEYGAIRLRGYAGNLHIDEVRGGVGLAVEEPGYNDTVIEFFATTYINVNAQTTETVVKCGLNTLMSRWTQYGGNHEVRSELTTGALATFDFFGYGGFATLIEGNYAIATFELRGAIVTDKHAATLVVQKIDITIANSEATDIFEAYLNAPQWQDAPVFVDSSQSLSLAKIVASSAVDATTATELEAAIQATFDNGPISRLDVTVASAVVTISGIDYSEWTIKTRTVDGGGTDDQTAVVSTNQALSRFSISKINVYSGEYDGTKFSRERYIGHVEFFGGGTVKHNDTTFIDRISGRKDLVGV